MWFKPILLVLLSGTEGVSSRDMDFVETYKSVFPKISFFTWSRSYTRRIHPWEICEFDS